MKSIFKQIVVGIIIISFALPVIAAKPTGAGGVPFGNGFPSGEHFNLNILAKKDHFNCPAPKYDEVTGQQVYGNVVFIPRVQGNNPITILMESGKKGPKGAQDISVLQVSDWCTESFPDGGNGQGDSAIVRIPQNDRGYAVYARITGKPADDGPEVNITQDLVYVQDEAGNDLIMLGLVDKQGVSKFKSDGQTLYRTSTTTTEGTTKGKGAQKATNITSLFEWTGDVCYIQDDSDIYCINEYGQNTCSDYQLCCVDEDGDGVFESCEPLAEVGVVDPNSVFICPETDAAGLAYDSITAQCKAYDNEWVFNIADFVGYLWDLDTTGAYNIQVRFYPM